MQMVASNLDSLVKKVKMLTTYKKKQFLTSEEKVLSQNAYIYLKVTFRYSFSGKNGVSM